jgi:predicted Zn-dependent peptidase
MDINHVAGVDLENVKEFFFSHYAPNNAILTITGNITFDRAAELSSCWFGPIPRRNIAPRNLPPEPVQDEQRSLTIKRDLPSDAIYKVWHTGPRNSPDFHTLDLITDLLAGGESGRLHTKLVRDKKLFSEINAYLTSDIDPGLIILHGKLMKGVDIENADNSVNEVINGLQDIKGIEEEMEKVKNKYEASAVFSNTSILHKAVSLAHYELLGDPDLINSEVEIFRRISSEMVADAAEKYFRPSNCSSLYYKSTRKGS